MARYFVDVDSYGDVAVFAASTDDYDPQPIPILYEYELKSGRARDAWPIIAAALVAASNTPAEVTR